MGWACRSARMPRNWRFASPGSRALAPLEFTTATTLAWAADYALQMADAACLGIVTTNSSPAMVPWGAAKKFLGTNPICFGAPTHGSPLILDMATSVVAMGHVVLAEKRGPINSGYMGGGTRRPAHHRPYACQAGRGASVGRLQRLGTCVDGRDIHVASHRRDPGRACRGVL